MGIKGTLTKGSAIHRLYEAMMTHPTDTFIPEEVWNEIKHEFPNMSLRVAANIIGGKFKKMGIVSNFGTKWKSKETGRRVSVYERKIHTTQPVIQETGATERSPKTLRKKKPPTIPDQIDTTQLGEAIIDYIKYLQERITSFASDCKASSGRAKSTEYVLRKEIQTLTYQNDGLKKNNADLIKKLAQKNRTFNTREVLDFQKRKAQSNGL